MQIRPVQSHFTHKRPVCQSTGHPTDENVLLNCLPEGHSETPLAWRQAQSARLLAYIKHLAL